MKLIYPVQVVALSRLAAVSQDSHIHGCWGVGMRENFLTFGRTMYPLLDWAVRINFPLPSHENIVNLCSRSIHIVVRMDRF